MASSRFICFWMHVLMRPSVQSVRKSRRAFSNSFIRPSRCASWLVATPRSRTRLANTPVNVGSLLEFAVQKTNPTYPSTARTLRQTGVVRLEVIVDEDGKVSQVQNLTGPSLLQNAAKDAVKKWKFKPFLRDGQPVKATGFLSFNFNL